MPEFGDLSPVGVLYSQLSQKCLIVHILSDGASRLRTGQKAPMIEALQQRPTLTKRPRAIETHRIEPLENVAVLAMLRHPAMLFDPPLLSTSTPSSSRRASSSSVNLATRRLRLHARQKRHPLRHPLLPGVGRGDRRQAPALLLELQGPFGEFPRLLDREVDALAGDYGFDLLQTLLIHRLGEDGIGFAEWVDPVDQVDVQEFAISMDGRGRWLER